MSEKFRIFRRASGVWYLEEKATHHQESLRTRVEADAKRLLHARNEAHRMPGVNLQIARAYVVASDPKMSARTWSEVMALIVAQKEGENHRRWSVATRDPAFRCLLNKPLMETNSECLLRVMQAGTVSTNVYLRRIHNYSLDMDWLLKAIIPKRQWPKVVHRSKRAITPDEHQRILEREVNPERKVFYQLCWHLGGSQSDIACLTANDIDWQDHTIGYNRKKLEGRAVKPPLIHFGREVADILHVLPQVGALFPYLCSVRANDRATEFKQRCDGLGIKGVTLHSYRYAWAERARKCGYPQRFAQEALGHNSKAVHHAYAKKAEVRVPSLDQWEEDMSAKIVRLGEVHPEAPTEHTRDPVTLMSAKIGPDGSFSLERAMAKA